MIRSLVPILALGYLISRIDGLIMDVRNNKSPTILNLCSHELILKTEQIQLVKHYRGTKTILFDGFSDRDDRPGRRLDNHI